MKSITVEVSERASEFLDAEKITALVEAEAERLYHIRRSIPLTRQEKDLRAAIGKEAYNKLSDAEKTRMLSCIEYPE